MKTYKIVLYIDSSHTIDKTSRIVWDLLSKLPDNNKEYMSVVEMSSYKMEKFGYKTCDDCKDTLIARLEAFLGKEKE